MKTNTMKLIIIFGFLLTLDGILYMLFMKSIPTGNGDVAYLAVGAVMTILTVIVSSMFKKD